MLYWLSIQICVANVVNATCYYARVLEHRAQDGTLTDLSTTTLSITFELKNWFSVEKNCIRLGELIGTHFMGRVHCSMKIENKII